MGFGFNAGILESASNAGIVMEVAIKGKAFVSRAVSSCLGVRFSLMLATMAQ
jgi:hypothetical protein